MSGIGMRLWRAVCDTRRYRFYGYDPAQGPGRRDPDVQVYDTWRAVPRPFRSTVAPHPAVNVMYHRLRRGKARLLCLSGDGKRLDAYGWIQDWSVFRRRYGAIARDGVMLGFYWTAPARRGRGLYGRLLAHSLALCAKDRPIRIGTSPDNRASQRGIEKAGFRWLGDWKGRVYFRCWSTLRRVAGPGAEDGDGLS